MTSRSSARRWSAISVGERLARRRARRRFRRSTARSSAIASSGALGQRSALAPAVAHSAARRPGQQSRCAGPSGLEQRAQREQVVAERLVGARRARSRARSAAAPRRARCRAARGARRGCRRRAARPPARRVTTSIPCGRPPAPSASGFHEPPPIRAQASAPSVTRPSPNSRSARSRSLQHLASARERVARIVLLEREHHDEVVGPAPRRPLRAPPAGSPCSASRLGDRQALRQRQISAEVIVRPCRRRDERDLAGAAQRGAPRGARAPRAAARGAARSRSARRTPRAAARRSRRARPRGRGRRSRRDPRRARQVAVEPVEAREQRRRLARGRAAARARRARSAMNSLGQRPVAVERGAAERVGARAAGSSSNGTSAPAAISPWRNAAAASDVLGSGRLQLQGTHGALTSRSPGALLPGAARLARCAALSGATERRRSRLAAQATASVCGSGRSAHSAPSQSSP